jgi:predicted ATPase
MNCLTYASWTLWLLGYPDQALKKSREALALAAGTSHPFAVAHTLGLAASFYLLRREEPLARERAETVITLATEQGFPFWLAHGMIVRGGALAEQGQVQEGIAQVQQGLVAFRATRAEGRLPYFLALLAEAYRQGGQAEERLSVLAEARATVDKTGERFYEAELYRLKGELLLTQEGNSQKSKVKNQKSKVGISPQPLAPSPQAQAEECFLKAIEIAQKQQAKSLELRAVMSLVRLRQYQTQNHESPNTQHEIHNRLNEAHKLLAEVYNWFTEGFDTKDLQEAKALLEELS